LALLTLENIHKDYVRGKVPLYVLKGVSLTIARGEMVALMGASGSGKTTLINILGSLDKPTIGHYWLDGQDISELSERERAFTRNQKIGFVFQNFNLLPRMSALENVMLPLAYSPERLSERECRERATELLERVGLGDRVVHEPSQLSGGEQQRVAIARALANRSSILIADEPTGNLDSHTGEEILRIFQKLNAEEGLTVILVTHDPYVAAHAGRIVRMRDGLLVEDDDAPANESTQTPAARGSRDAEIHGDAIVAVPKARLRARPALRFLPRTTVTALRSLRRNVLRSVLTTLGIIIGVGSLIAIAEIGKGSSTAIQEILLKTGVSNLLIQAGAASRNGLSLGSGSIKTLMPEDADAILHECPAVASLAPIVNAKRQVIRGGRNWVPIYLLGTTPGYLEVRDWTELTEGEPFTDHDVRDAAMVCVIGKTLVDELFPDESPIGQEVFVSDVPLQVVGVLKAKGANIIGEDQDDILLTPWTTMKYRVSAASTSGPAERPAGPMELAQQVNDISRRFPRARTSLYPTPSASQLADTPKLERLSNVDSILVRAHSIDEIPAAKEQIRQLLRERHHISYAQQDDFAVRDFTDVLLAVQATVALVAGLLLCVALISLVVGGVGIMNIMLVSVTERYREIGLRMAVGAGPADILRQFLVEAIVLCVLGGAVGILVGRSGSLLVRAIAGWPTEASLLAIVAAVGVSVTVGLIFGYYPAWKASRLNPIDALRYE
jgi:macrolide transport system ATP-binding/permease protein